MMVRSAPRVTGLSPKEGPPGTRIIVRGENLGTSAHDLLSVSICGVECVFQAEWQSPSKILCRSGNGQGLGDVVVTTKSGGRGACTVQFRGFMDAVGPTKETAVWVDDSRFIEGAGRSQPATSTGFVEGQDPLALSDEPTPCIYTEEQLLEIFSEGSGNITRENFVPAWYLLENHSGATLEDLKHGLKHMQSQNKHQGGDGPVAFLKSHLGSYFECIDTLDNLEVRFGEDSDKFLDNVDSLIDRISSARDLSNRTYEAVFQRRQKIDLYRHCISTVNRFHYVFDLLSSIHKNIKTRHFRAVVTDHKKLQQLLGKSQVKGLQDVFREVEAKVNSLKNTLREELKQMPGEPESQIQTCRNLSELGDEGDFGWECITDVHTYIVDKMFEIYSFYFTDVANAVYDLKRCLQSKMFQNITFHIQVISPFDLEGDTFDQVVIIEPTSAHREKHEPISSSTSICQLINVVSEALAKSLDHLNRLCEAYFQGEMKKSGKDMVPPSDQSKFARQKEMIVEAVELYVVIIQCVLKSRETMIKSEEFLEAVSAVTRVRKAVQGHRESSLLLKTLLVAMKKSVVLALLDRGVSEMESVSASAFERPDKTLRLASKLPELFTTVSAKTLTMTKPFLLPDSVFRTNVLEESGSTEALLEKWNRLFNVPIETLREFGDRGTGIVVFFSLMSAHIMIEKVLPRLFAMLKTLFGETGSSFHSTLEDRYADLSVDLTKSFVEMKAEPIMGVIEKQMNDHGIDWKHATEPKGVNSYVTRIAMDLNQVLEELSVFANDPAVNDEIMRGIVTKVCEEVNRLFFVAPGFNVNGALQGILDITALRSVIGPYMSKAGEKMLDEAVRLLAEQNVSRKNEAIARIVSEYMKTHKMLFLGPTQ